MEPERIKELGRRVELGQRLTDLEIEDLREHHGTQLMLTRPGIDFAETETYLHGGNLQRDALVSANARAARFRRQQPQAPKPFFSDSPIPQPPASVIPCGPLYQGKRGIERMLDTFRSKLSEVIETGRLP